MVLKAAVIGVGYMGRNHARIYAGMDNVELVAVADASEDAAELAKRYKVPFYKDYKEMLEKEKPELLSIAVPTDMHKKVAIDAIEQGANVLLEKPIAKNRAEAENILKAAKEKGVKLMIGHIERFNPAVRELKKRLGEKELGKVYKIEVRRCGPFPTRISDVGVTVDLAVHDIDVINYLLDRPGIKRIKAETEQRVHESHEDLLTALIKYENNALAVLNIDWLTPTKERQISITGERGRFVVDYITQDLYFFENALLNERFEYAGTALGVVEGNSTKFMVPKKEPLLLELEAFVEMVEKEGSNGVSAEDAMLALETAQNILEAAKKKGD